MLDDTLSVPENGTGTVTPLANDSDPDGHALTVTSVGQPGNGTATLNPDGTVTYVPNPNYSGPDSFTVTVCDAIGACDTSTVNVTVVHVNQAPIIRDDAAGAPVSTPTVIDVLNNDTDADGDPLSVTTLTQPANGTASVNPDDTVTYTPDPGFKGTDTFDYTACDTSGECGTATVTVFVPPPGSPPVAADDAAVTNEATAVTVDVLVNDTDPDNDIDPSSISLLTLPAHGIALADVDGTIHYLPADGFSGTDSLRYQICDTTGLCATATVNITVVAVPYPPTPADDTFTTPEGVAVSIAATANDTDPDDNLDVASVSIVAPPAHGSVMAQSVQ